LEVIKKAPTCPSTPRPFHPPGVTGDEDEGVNACEDDSFKKFKYKTRKYMQQLF
jgi:hypothetical protein